MEIQKVFQHGDRVIVSSAGGWRKDSTGTVVAGPESIQTIQGDDFFYWIEFDEPQDDLSDDGPYYKAQILSRYISKEEKNIWLEIAKTFGKVLAWGIVIFNLALFSVGLHINYWQFYDLGELYPNRFVGSYAILPALFLFLAISTPLTLYLWKKIVKSKIIVTLLTFISLLVISIIPFIFEVIRSSKTVSNFEFIDFLIYYFSR